MELLARLRWVERVVSASNTASIRHLINKLMIAGRKANRISSSGGRLYLAFSF